jgi:hypothetical protein
MINISIQPRIPTDTAAMQCTCILAPFGPNPECVDCGGSGACEREAEIPLVIPALDESTLRAKGFTFDPTGHGRMRWTHTASGRAMVRQPYMSDSQWTLAMQLFVSQHSGTQRAA